MKKLLFLVISISYGDIFSESEAQLISSDQFNEENNYRKYVIKFTSIPAGQSCLNFCKSKAGLSEIFNTVVDGKTKNECVCSFETFGDSDIKYIHQNILNDE